MDLQALLFDFDGLVLDTETPSFESWVAIFREQGVELALGDYIQCVGTHGSAFDAVSRLEEMTGRSQDREALQERHRRTAMERIVRQAPLPGVVPLLREARERGIRCAVASSSPSEWVVGHLDRLGLRDRFDSVVCRHDVERVKPAPDLFLEALKRLRVSPGAGAVFEDSLNGVKAAKTAGLFCVAVPNAVTRGLPLDGADLLLPSLEGFTLAVLEKAFR